MPKREKRLCSKTFGEDYTTAKPPNKPLFRGRSILPLSGFVNVNLEQIAQFVNNLTLNFSDTWECKRNAEIVDYSNHTRSRDLSVLGARVMSLQSLHIRKENIRAKKSTSGSKNITIKRHQQMKGRKMTKPVHKPGQIVPRSGQYIDKSSGTETTLVKDKTFPPTSKPNSGFVLVDPTKHKPPKEK